MKKPWKDLKSSVGMVVVLRRDMKHEASKGKKKDQIIRQTHATILPIAIPLPPLERTVSRNNAVSTKI